jgi:hypothetical protein
MRRVWLLLAALCGCGANVPLDLSEVRPGPVTVEPVAGGVAVRWPDEAGRMWKAEFSLDPDRPLITSIGTGARQVVDRATPLYWITTGKRRGGWDEFFDLPPAHPDGTRQFRAGLRLRSAKARTTGERVEVMFDGLEAGIFRGAVAYTFFPGSRLIQQEARLTTAEPDTAYYYDAGIRLRAEQQLAPGGNMDSQVVYYDTGGQLRAAPARGPEREIIRARYRTLAFDTGAGSLAVFPPPHQYFFARDFTTNLGYLWHSAWRGAVSAGIRQWPDDNTAFYPWMNAPPGTEQRMTLFVQLSDRDPAVLLEELLRYTHQDRFPQLAGYKTITSHWHFAYTVQALARGFDWIPPFKPVLKAMGVDAAILSDFHGDGHPRDLTDLRLKELDAYFRACRAQSDPEFLLIPSEEANVHYGGHYTVLFPQPVYWFMSRPPGTPFVSEDARFGWVYRVADAGELLDLVRRERGLVYQTHPRTKGSAGYPDKIRGADYFRDASFFGAGWKAMPSDLSSPRLGERAFKLLDDMANWGLRKRLLGEVDVFQIDETHELYAHMNVNYVRLKQLPAWERYGEVLKALARGEFFVTTGEVLLPEVHITPASADTVLVRAAVRWTFPLRMAEVVWGDGTQTRREIFSLESTRPFGAASFEWKVKAPGWRWARLAVWDVAANGAFVNPVWR